MTHIGFMQFSDRKNTGIRFNLDNNYDATTISKKFENMPWHAGRKTLTHLALDIVAQKVFTKKGGDRPDVPDLLIVLTDGKSNYPDKTRKNAQKLKNMGVRIIAIGAVHDLQNDVKNREIWQELQDIASSPKDVKMIDFANLVTVVSEIVCKVCPPCNCPSNTEKKSAQVKPGETKAFVSWLEPKPSCLTNSSENMRSTSRWFSVGEHTLTYKYTPKTGKQQLECHVKITVTGEFCGERVYEPTSQICCCGQVHKRKTINHKCCGKRYINHSKKICCQGQKLVDRPGSCPN
ncbi:Hypothetical predicted protein [Paramuricea clavata]|uniref:Uncharacterized protein n=1 Tax=Paramuricea clavata TaxID=317549 RepID=A0A7D9JD94_PARCT|nr:Hypothetical predicted protein [Paramuricea clavata]